MKTKKILFALAAIMCAGFAFASHEVVEVPAYPNFNLPRVEEMMFLVLQIGVIIFAARLGGAVASMLKLPSILGELAAGIVIGPWALGGIPFLPITETLLSGEKITVYHSLFHGDMLKAMSGNVDATSPALYGIATLASIILLFLSGLETNLKMFLKYSFVGSMVGVGGVVVSFLFGDLCAVYLLPNFFDSFAYLKDLPFEQAITQAAPLFMGIMSTATSVGITARILSEKKKMDSEEGVTIMAGAVIDDVLGLIVLAIGMQIIGSSASGSGTMNWGAIGGVAAKAFGIWLGATIIGIVAARYIAKFLKKCFKSPVVISTMAFGLALILAGFFELMGLAMIIGAYVMGLALSRTDLKHMIQETLTPVYTFLVPIFFCAMGMMVDVSKLCSTEVLIFGGIYTILAVFAKIIGCMIPSMACGFNTLGGLRIGAGMVPRGEVALIIAGLGLSTLVNGKPILTQEIFGIGILMTLVTTVVAPPALVALFGPKKSGVRHPKPNKDSSRQVSFELSGPDVAELIIGKLVEEFRNEGFVTSLLSQEGSIWEIAMDDMELSIRREENKIVFGCTPAEEAIVMTAWMEVAGKMSDLAKQILKPIRREEVDKLLTEDSMTTAARSKSSVSRYLQGFVMLPKFKATSKRDAIENMIKAIADSCPNALKDAPAALEAVMKREEAMPTGLDHGIAVPHGRLSAVEGIIGAVAILDNEGTANGCVPDYETIDNSPLRIIVLTLANSDSQTPYLQLMSFISRALRSDAGYDRLAECKTPDEMRKFFRKVK